MRSDVMSGAARRGPNAGDGGAGGFRLNGWHVLAILILFFGVVFTANFFLVRAALGTFSGTESDTAYKDGLAYNTEIEASKRQDALGWTVDAHVERSAEGHARIDIQGVAKGQPLGGLDGTVKLEFPADKKFDRAGDLVATGSGHWRAEIEDVAPGQWDLIVTLNKGGERMFMSRNRVTLR
jgi:nitrogen fixation protein FixH